MQGTQAGAQRTGTTQRPPTDQDLQNAARDLREAVRNNVNQELIAARANAAANAALAQTRQNGAPVIVTPPVPPQPHQFTIRGPDGRQTVVGIPPGAFDNTIPQQAVDITIAFFITLAIIIIGLPLARAFARKMDRRSSAPVSPEIGSQLAHLNQAVDAIALEVERISEGQRFTTRLLSEQREAARQTLPSGINR
jgi:hypothetical protein